MRALSGGGWRARSAGMGRLAGPPQGSAPCWPRGALRWPGQAAEASAPGRASSHPKGARPLIDVAGGWGVEVPGDGNKKAQPSERQQQPPQQQQQQQQQPPPQQQQQQQQLLRQRQQRQQEPGGKQKIRTKRQSTPFVSLQNPEARLGLAKLHQSLAASQAAAGEPQPQLQAGLVPVSRVSDVKASLTEVAAMAAAGKRHGKLPAMQARRSSTQPAAPLVEDGDDFNTAGEVPAFQLTFGENGTELIEFDQQGRPVTKGLGANEDGAAWAEEEDNSFGVTGWDQFGAVAEEGSDADDDYSSAAPQGREAEDVHLLRDLANEDDWGLEALALGAGAAGGLRRPSLLAQMARERREARGGGAAAASPLPVGGGGYDVDEDDGAGSDALVWGGSAGATGIDLEEQEELLRRYFRPHEVKRYMAAQREVHDNWAAMKARAAGVGVSEQQLHSQLKIVAGSAAGRRLVSARGAQTRPMMERVRAAVFDMVQSQAGSVGGLPPGCRWLDLFAGTGSVGLEALSRGAREAHFVEMDPWVHRRVLQRNIAACGFSHAVTCHMSRAEDFLRRAAAAPRFASGPFDFVSVCPPYLLVSYSELYDLLEASSLVHAGSIVIVEYPKQLAHQVRPVLGPLDKVRDRKYGRTWVAVYAADGSRGGGGDDEPAGGGVAADWGL